MNHCPDCYGHAGEREFAIGWVDDRGDEHRRTYMTLCGCAAGADLHERSTRPEKDGLVPHHRISYQKARAGWQKYIAAKGWVMLGWWVTSREMPRLPEAARFTVAECVEIEQRRAAYRAAKEAA